MAKIISPNGILELIFLGAGEQVKRGADGLLEAALTSIACNFNDEILGIILKKVTSICTDAAHVNTGGKGGLWALLEKKCEEAGSRSSLIKIWCAAHRTDLAWKDLMPKSTKSVAQLSPEVKCLDKILTILSSFSSYFHNSATRTHELRQIGEELGVKVLSMPKLFTVRWTEFTYNLLRSILTSWRAIVTFLAKNERTCAKSKGFLQHLTSLKFLKMVAFLADVLAVFKRMQKKLQSDALTLMKMSHDIAVAISVIQWS